MLFFQPRLEVMWAMKAYNHAEVYFNVRLTLLFMLCLSFTVCKLHTLSRFQSKSLMWQFVNSFINKQSLSITIIITTTCVSSWSHLWIQSSWNWRNSTTKSTRASGKLSKSSTSKCWRLTTWSLSRPKRSVTHRAAAPPHGLWWWCVHRLLVPVQTWRPFCNQFEGQVEDFNYGTLLRLDCEKDYTEENTIFGL